MRRGSSNPGKGRGLNRQGGHWENCLRLHRLPLVAEANQTKECVTGGGLIALTLTIPNGQGSLFLHPE